MKVGIPIYEDKWLEIFEEEPKPKTKVFSVWSKCSDTQLGKIRWYPSWRHYCFIINFEEIEVFTKLFIFSDRCMLAIGNFTKTLNEDHKYTQKSQNVQGEKE